MATPPTMQMPSSQPVLTFLRIRVVHQHHDAKVQKVRQNAVQHILQHQTGACEGNGGSQTHHACHHGTNDHQTHDAADVHQLVHHAAVELGQVLAAHGVAQLTGKPCDQHRGDDGDDHSQNGAQNAALLCQRDAQTKSDQADSALEEGVAHTGQGTHQRGLDGVDGLRVEVLTVGGVLLLHGSSQTQRKGTGLRGAVVERHVTVVGLFLSSELLGVGLIRIEAIERGNHAVEEAHVHLTLVVPRGLDGPGAPEELADLLVQGHVLGCGCHSVFLLSLRRLRADHSRNRHRRLHGNR